MNYLSEIVAFTEWKEVNQLPASAIALWYELMAICNKTGWRQEFTVPNGLLQIKAGLSRKEFEHARQLLIYAGRIQYKKSNRVNQAGKYELIPIVQKGQQEVQQKGQRDEHRKGNERGILYKPKRKLKLKLKKDKDIVEQVPFQEIIDHLNARAGTNYQATTKSTKEHINARWKEGRRLPDFLTVINKKAQEWLGTDQEQYLRPQTLFGTKFENYLNQPWKGGQPSADNRRDNGQSHTLTPEECAYYGVSPEDMQSLRGHD